LQQVALDFNLSIHFNELSNDFPFLTASLSTVYISDAEEILQISQCYQGSAVHLILGKIGHKGKKNDIFYNRTN